MYVQDVYKKLKFEKEVQGSQLKVWKQVTNLSQSLKSMYHPVLATVITQSQSTCTNKVFSSTSTRFNPYFGWYKIQMHNIPGKVEIISCRYGKECFIYTCIWL